MKYLYENSYINEDAIALKTKIKQTPNLREYFDSSYDKIKPKTNYCSFSSQTKEIKFHFTSHCCFMATMGGKHMFQALS